MKKYQRFLSEIFQFLEVKFSVYLNRRIFVMQTLPLERKNTEKNQNRFLGFTEVLHVTAL